jgi:hypothetical protein
MRSWACADLGCGCGFVLSRKCLGDTIAPQLLDLFHNTGDQTPDPDAGTGGYMSISIAALALLDQSWMQKQKLNTRGKKPNKANPSLGAALDAFPEKNITTSSTLI